MDIDAKRSGRFIALALLAIIVVGIVIRVHGLTIRSLWFDEAFSWRLCQFALSEVITRCARDNHPPLYFLILKAWTSVCGDSVLALRGMSIVLASATMLGMYLFMVEAYKQLGKGEDDSQSISFKAQTLGLFAAALVAVSVFQIRWAWEVRMYMLGTALSAFSSWSLFYALNERDRPLRRWLLYAALTLLLAYTHYYCLFTIIAQFVFVGGCILASNRCRMMEILYDPRLRYVVIAGSIIAVGFLPQIPVFLRQREQVQADYWTLPVSRWDIPFAVYQAFVCPEDAVMNYAGSAAAAAIVCAVLLALMWRPSAADWYVLAMAIGPLIISLLITQFDTKIFHVRYFLFSHLFLLAALARLVCRWPVHVRRIAAAFMILNALATYAWFWNEMDFVNRPGARGVAAFLANERRPEEPVISCSGVYFFSNLYHAANRSGYYCYDQGDGEVHWRGGAVLMDEEMITKGEIAAIASPRIWVVNMEAAGWGYQYVPMPANRHLARTARFREAYGVQGTMVLQAYDTDTASDAPRTAEK